MVENKIIGSCCNYVRKFCMGWDYENEQCVHYDCEDFIPLTEEAEQAKKVWEENLKES